MKRRLELLLALLDGFCLLIAWPFFVIALLTAPSWLGGLLQLLKGL